MFNNYVMGFSLGMMFTVALSFGLKEHTVIYKENGPQ
jgi:hypothetical protein